MNSEVYQYSLYLSHQYDLPLTDSWISSKEGDQNYLLQYESIKNTLSLYTTFTHSLSLSLLYGGG